ncbi:MAG: hypothetical protein NPIRA06_15140 [Nitrospirales bacterium]|nr:MAG: hypothetical protein NPIRA06_15140 [Nitrospirales bacterium]
MPSTVLFTWLYRVFVGVLLIQGLWEPINHELNLGLPSAWAEPYSISEKETHHNHPAHHQIAAPQVGQWEGSPEGIAYSEFNHALVGVGVILVGLSEWQRVMGWQALMWFRWLLPSSLIGSGIFLLIWSDHLAWPIGSWTLAETLSGKDPEMLQHKIFGILAMAVGLVEGFLRAGKLSHMFWRSLLPGFALVGGLMLFRHMHGLHPSGHDIQTHHNIMGTLALAGGIAWFAGEFMPRSQAALQTTSRVKFGFKILWALLVITIGMQLLFYSES